MSKLNRVTTLWLIGLVFLGCETKGLYDKLVREQDVVTLSRGVAIHDKGNRRIVYLEAAPGEATISELFKYSKSEKIEWVKAGPSASVSTELFLMSMPTDVRDPDARETLVRISIEDKRVRRYETGSRFDKLSFDPVGKYAILHGAGGAGEGGFYSPNEVALINLSKSPGADNPLLFTVNMGNRRISSIRFLPELTVGGRTVNLVAFLAEGAIKLADLSNPTEIGTLVPLVASDDTRTVSPAKVLVRDEDESRNAMVFVLAGGSQDVYGISLSREEGGARLGATLNQFEAGGYPSDMVIAEDGDTPLLVVLSPRNNSARVNVVQIDTSETFSIQLDDSVNRAFLHQAESSTEIVFYGDNSNGIHYLTVDSLATQKGRNLDDVLIPDRVSRAMLLDQNRLLLVSQKSGDIIVMDLNSRKSTRFASPKEMDWDGASVFNDRLYFLTEFAKEIDIVDLQTEHPISLLLDDPASSLHLLKGTGAGVVLHSTPSGRATVFDLADPSRANSLVVDGIWFNHFLGETEAK